MTCFDGVKKRLENVMDRAGVSMTIRRLSTTFDPSSTASTLAQTQVDTAVKGIVDVYESKFVDGTIIQRNDRKITIPLVDITPIPDEDQLIIDGATHEIINVNKVYSGGSVSMFEVQARK